MAIRVTVWNEYLHEVQFPEVLRCTPRVFTAVSQTF